MREIKVFNHLGAQQAHDIRKSRVPIARVKLCSHCGTPYDASLFEDADTKSRQRQVVGCGQTIMTGTNNNRVVFTHAVNLRC